MKTGFKSTPKPRETASESLMSNKREIRRCAVCAWRGECRKKFCVPDSGARCPDFTRDVTIKDRGEDEAGRQQTDNLEE